MDTNVIGYRVRYGTMRRAYGNVVNAGASTVAVITGLTEGKTYFFVVTAYNALGLESAPSNEVSYTVPLPPAPPAGSYYGLFYEESGVRPDSAGSFVMSLNSRGAYSGRLQNGARRYPFSGRLNLRSQAANIVRRSGTNTLTLQLTVGTGSRAGELFGQVTDGTWISTLLGDRAAFNTRTNPAPYAGTYTIVFPGQDNDPTVPAGDGFGTVRVDRSGWARLAGALADGTKVSQSAPLSQTGQWPLHVSLCSGAGLMMSWISFTNEAQSDLCGALSWIKPPHARARYYSNGFATELSAAGSAYAAPGGAIKSLLNLPQGKLVFSGGNLASNFTNSVALGLDGRVSKAGGNRVAMSFSSSSGAFKGTASDPATGRALSFRGVVMQKLNAGYGFLLGTNQSSRVVLAQ